MLILLVLISQLKKKSHLVCVCAKQEVTWKKAWCEHVFTETNGPLRVSFPQKTWRCLRCSILKTFKLFISNRNYVRYTNLKWDNKTTLACRESTYFLHDEHFPFKNFSLSDFLQTNKQKNECVGHQLGQYTKRFVLFIILRLIRERIMMHRALASRYF